MKWHVMAGIALTLLAWPVYLNGQYYFYNDKYYAGDVIIEAGSTGGIMNSLTDLGGRKGPGKDFIKDLNWKIANPAFGLYLAILYKDAIAIRLEAIRGQVCSYDSLLKQTDPDLASRYGRNLSFRSYLYEWLLTTEIHPLFFRLYDKNKAPYWSPYIVTGLGYFSFNPQAFLKGRWYDLRPLRLEGQGFSEYPHRRPYSLRQLNLPVGLGIKYESGPLLHIRVEIIHRILFTDYLDDVSTTYIDPSLFLAYLSPEQAAIAHQLHSRIQELQPGYINGKGTQRGDPKDRDAYFTIQLKVGWVMRSKRR